MSANTTQSSAQSEFPMTKMFLGWASVVMLIVLVGLMWRDKNQQIAALHARLDVAESTLHLTTFSDAVVRAEKDDKHVFTVVDDVDVSLPGVERIIFLQSAGTNGSRGALYAVPSYTFPGGQFESQKAPKGAKCYPEGLTALGMTRSVCFTPAQLESVW